MNTARQLLAAATVAAWLTSCATIPAPTLLALPTTSHSPQAAAPSSEAKRPLLAVRRVTLPEYLLSRRVRYRAEASTLAEWPNTYWAERVEVAVSRELMAALRQQLPGWAVCEASCGDQTPTLAVQIDFETLDFVRPTQTLQARTRVSVSSAGATPALLLTRELSDTVPATADTPQGHALALSGLMERVARVTAPWVKSAGQ